jgi:hypothetical protein
MPVKINPNIEDLRLAWRRVNSDRPHRVFVNHPHLIAWIEYDLDRWLENLRSQLVVGYNPKQCQICQVPKQGFLLRPASFLDIEDEVIYTYLVGMLFEKIYAVLSEFQGDPDVAYQLNGQIGAVDWIQSDFLIWKQWRERSVTKLADNISYVVATDITGYYDNIDINRLLSDVRSAYGDSPTVQLLSQCLNHWAHPRGKGIPQGYSASDVLAKLYLNSVDQTLRNDGYTHLRYVDDIRIFMRSKREAKQAISRLSHLMHQRGLSLQSAKTELLTKSEAKTKFDGVTPIITDVQNQLFNEVRNILGLGEASISASQLTELLDHTTFSPPEVLERTFEERFSLSGADQFDKTLFHYLLTRLAKVGSRIAVDYCVETLRSRPEESDAVLRYLGVVGFESHQLDKMIAYFQSEEALYDFQLYQFIRWAYDKGLGDQRIIRMCRNFAFDQNRGYWLRGYSVAYLGRYGDGGDLELIENNYARLAADIEKADYVAAVYRQEKARRNAFYGRVQGDNDLVRRATELIKKGG